MGGSLVTKESILPTFEDGSEVVVFVDGELKAEGKVEAKKASAFGMRVTVNGEEFYLSGWRSSSKTDKVVILDKAGFERASSIDFVSEHTRLIGEKIKMLKEHFTPADVEEMVGLLGRMDEIVSAYDDNWKSASNMRSLLKFSGCQGVNADEVKDGVLDRIIEKCTWDQVNHVKAISEHMMQLEKKEKEKEQANNAT